VRFQAALTLGESGAHAGGLTESAGGGCCGADMTGSMVRLNGGAKRGGGGVRYGADRGR